MQEIKLLEKKLEDLPGKVKAIRQEVLENAGVQLKQNVDRSIDDSGVKDPRGKVKRWQVIYPGSKGGYMAVRAENTTSGKNSPGAITNYLEGGHKTLRKDNRKRERTKAFRFYESANAKRLPEVHRQVKKELTRKLEEAVKELER